MTKSDTSLCPLRSLRQPPQAIIISTAVFRMNCGAAIVKELQPDFVVCENVKGLRSMLDGAVERKIIEDNRAIGYQMNVTLLCAADYYVPQKRERDIFIGNRIGKTNYHPKPFLTADKHVTMRRFTKEGDLASASSLIRNATCRTRRRWMSF